MLIKINNFKLKRKPDTPGSCKSSNYLYTYRKINYLSISTLVCSCTQTVKLSRKLNVPTFQNYFFFKLNKE